MTESLQYGHRLIVVNNRLSVAEISQIRTLVLVSQLGSLAAAARTLNISPAAVSKQLTCLEKELGVLLLIRSTRRVEFTEIGVNYCVQCQRILEEVDTAANLISGAKKTPHGSLKIFSGRHFAAAYIVPYLQKFLTRFPEIEVCLELGERIPDLEFEGIDVLIGMSLSATGDVIQKRIGTTRYVYCASPDYLAAFGEPIKPLDLLTHRYITHGMRKPNDELVFPDKEVIRIKPYLRVNDTETMLKLSENGIGIVKLHDYVVNEHLKKGLLVKLFTSYTEPEIPLYLAFPRRRYIPAQARCFIDFFSAVQNLHFPTSLCI